jgi:cytochrome oxidase Cu insertion factor (SCO1/SenC/PrrC family)
MLQARCLGLAFLAAALFSSLAPGAAAARWGKDYLPNAAVVTQDGKALRFYDDLIKDKIFVVSFLFTTCKDICPLTTARLAELQEKLGDSMGRDIFFYSISIDPETDTPERLKQYADTFRAGPGWLFLTGRPADIHAIRHKLGERSKVLSDHRNEILLGNGATGEWARNNALGDLDSLALTVRGMDPRWRLGAHVARADAKALHVDFAARPGQALFKRLCAGCHTVGKGDRIGPDLAGVTGRRDRAWLARYIANPEKMRSERDPVALELAARYQRVRMPGLSIAGADADDLLAYIAHLEQQRAPPAQPDVLQPLSALTTQHGTRFSLDHVKGHPVAVVFGFTHCPDVCPTTLLDWSNVLAGLGADGDRLKVLFVSVDGERDTPDALAAYMASFDPRIVALTGNAAQIAAAARAYDAFYEKVVDSSGSYTFDHTVKTYFVDRGGQLAGAADLRTPEQDRRKTLDALLAQR